jgi:hypothetical protein
MIKAGDKRPGADFLFGYQHIVSYKYPSMVGSWPLLTGYDFIGGTFKGWTIAVFIDKGFMGGGGSEVRGVGELSEGVIGETEITPENRETVRARLKQYFSIEKRDTVVLYAPQGVIDVASELGVISYIGW